MSQKVYVLMTTRPTLRAEVEGWGGEDSALYVPDKPIGMTPGPKFPLYKTVLEALADGWKLLAPPVLVPPEPRGITVYTWDWWLVKE